MLRLIKTALIPYSLVIFVLGCPDNNKKLGEQKLGGDNESPICGANFTEIKSFCIYKGEQYFIKNIFTTKQSITTNFSDTGTFSPVFTLATGALRKSDVVFLSTSVTVFNEKADSAVAAVDIIPAGQGGTILTLSKSSFKGKNTYANLNAIAKYVAEDSVEGNFESRLGFKSQGSQATNQFTFVTGELTGVVFSRRNLLGVARQGSSGESAYFLGFAKTFYTPTPEIVARGVSLNTDTPIFLVNLYESILLDKEDQLFISAGATLSIEHPEFCRGANLKYYVKLDEEVISPEMTVTVGQSQRHLPLFLFASARITSIFSKLAFTVQALNLPDRCSIGFVGDNERNEGPAGFRIEVYKSAAKLISHLEASSRNEAHGLSAFIFDNRLDELIDAKKDERPEVAPKPREVAGCIIKSMAFRDLVILDSQFSIQAFTMPNQLGLPHSPDNMDIIALGQNANQMDVSTYHIDTTLFGDNYIANLGFADIFGSSALPSGAPVEEKFTASLYAINNNENDASVNINQVFCRQFTAVGFAKPR